MLSAVCHVCVCVCLYVCPLLTNFLVCIKYARSVECIKEWRVNEILDLSQYYSSEVLHSFHFIFRHDHPLLPRRGIAKKYKARVAVMLASVCFSRNDFRLYAESRYTRKNT